MKDSEVRSTLVKLLSIGSHERAFCLLYIHFKIGRTFSSAQKELAEDYDFSALQEKERKTYVRYSGPWDRFNKAESGGLASYLEDVNLLELFVVLDLYLSELTGKKTQRITLEYGKKFEVIYIPSMNPHRKYIKTKHQIDDPDRLLDYNSVLIDNFTFEFNLIEDTKEAWDFYLEQNKEKPSICISSFKLTSEDYEINIIKNRENQTSFVIKNIKCIDELETLVIETLTFAKHNECDVVIFPELTIPNKMLKVISKWLRNEDHSISYVIAGSFHFTDKVNNRVENCSTVYNYSGSTLVTHKKMTRFSASTLGNESIDTGATVNLMGLPFGLSVPLICKDFCDTNTEMGKVAHQARVDYFFVPTMGGEKTMDLHYRKAKEIYLMAAPVIALSNQDLDSMKTEDSTVDSVIYHGFLAKEDAAESTVIKGLGFIDFQLID